MENPSLMKGKGKFVASSKARNDASAIIKKFKNVVYVPIYRHSQNKIFGSLEVSIRVILNCFSIPKDSKVIIQYPMVNLFVFYRILFALKRHKVFALIHDLPSFRFDEEKKNRLKEISVLNAFSGVIVHTEKMLDVLKHSGVCIPMVPLKAFDYLLPLDLDSSKEDNGVVFAGALGKSVFLKYLNKLSFDFLHFNLYGGEKPKIEYNDNISYEGAFYPDDISKIKGEWGLLWDGNSCECCSGNFGEYLTIIAPHKFSLYVACGLKIISWEGSAMATFVIEENIGFTISNIKEIEMKINSLTNEEIGEMDINVKNLSEKLRKGNMLFNALSQFVDPK